MQMDREAFGAASAIVATLAAAVGKLWLALRSDRKPAPPPARVVHLPDDDAIDFEALFREVPVPILVLSPALFIVAVNDAYLRATLTTREGIVGRQLFEVFPDNQGDVGADGVANLRASLERVLTSRRADEMAIQRYDVRRPDGRWEERHWKPENLPVSGPDGAPRYIIHHVTDVTDVVRTRVA